MKNLDLGVRCGHFLSMKDGKSEVKKDIFLGISKGIISEVSDWKAGAQSRCQDFIDASGQIVMPGLINGHTHLPMTLFRGLEDDATFHHWLFERIIPLELDRVNPHFIKVGTELAALECLRFGVTTVNEMYFFAMNVADAWDKAGLRALIGQGYTDFPTPEDGLLGRDKKRLFKELHSKYSKHERITPSLCPHSPYTCDDQSLKDVASLAAEYNVPIHIHLSETRREFEESLKKYAMTPVKRLKNFGVLGPKTIAAHCVHLTEEDQELLRASGTAVAHNPDSNLKLGCGIAPISAYRKKGIPVAFGTDGAASNNDLSVFAAMDLGTKLQKYSTGDTQSMGATDALRCGTWEGAKALGLLEKVGSLEVGKEADFITIRLNYPNLQPLYDVHSLLVYSMSGHEVDTVVCRGKVLMQNQVFKTLDADRIYREAAEIASQVTDRIIELDREKK